MSSGCHASAPGAAAVAGVHVIAWSSQAGEPAGSQTAPHRWCSEASGRSHSFHGLTVSSSAWRASIVAEHNHSQSVRRRPASRSLIATTWKESSDRVVSASASSTGIGPSPAVRTRDGQHAAKVTGTGSSAGARCRTAAIGASICGAATMRIGRGAGRVLGASHRGGERRSTRRSPSSAVPPRQPVHQPVTQHVGSGQQLLAAHSTNATACAAIPPSTSLRGPASERPRRRATDHRLEHQHRGGHIHRGVDERRELGGEGEDETEASCQSWARLSAIAARITGSVSASHDAHQRERARLRSRLTITSTANIHQPMSARFGDCGKPVTPYTSHMTCPANQYVAAATHRPHRFRSTGAAVPRASIIPATAANEAAVQATSHQAVTRPPPPCSAPRRPPPRRSAGRPGQWTEPVRPKLCSLHSRSH